MIQRQQIFGQRIARTRQMAVRGRGRGQSGIEGVQQSLRRQRIEAAGSIAHRELSGASEGLKQRAMSSAEARLLGHEAGLGQNCGQFLIDGGALQ